MALWNFFFKLGALLSLSGETDLCFFLEDFEDFDVGEEGDSASLPFSVGLSLVRSGCALHPFPPFLWTLSVSSSSSSSSVRVLMREEYHFFSFLYLEANLW
jgi:hypothetical protein